MQDLGFLVEFPADPVPAELTHHAVPVGFGVLLYRVPDIAEMRPGAHCLDAPPEALEGHLAQAACLDGRAPDVKHPAGIAVEAILDDGDVNVDDVAGAEPPVAGHAMTHDVVHRRANRPRERAVSRRRIVEGRGSRLLHPGDVVVAEPVELLGGRARLDVGGDEIEDVGGESPGDPHLADFVGGLDADSHRALPRAAGSGGGRYLVFQGQRIVVQKPARRTGRRFP